MAPASWSCSAFAIFIAVEEGSPTSAGDKRAHELHERSPSTHLCPSSVARGRERQTRLDIGAGRRASKRTIPAASKACGRNDLAGGYVRACPQMQRLELQV